MVSTTATSAPAPPTGPSKKPATHDPTPNPTELLADLAQRATKFASTMDLQRTWGLSHFAFLCFAAVYLVNAVLFGSRLLAVSYKLAMLCLLAGYGIAVRRHLGPDAAMDMVTLERAFSYDGTPYFCMALMWWVMGRPVMVTVLPLMVYSLFHAIAWAKDDARVKQTAEWRQYGEPLCIRVSANQANLLFVAAHLEIFALPYMSLSWLVSRNHGGPTFSQLLFYVQFLRWQYSCSPKIRLAAKQWDQSWTALIQHPSCPKRLRAADRWCRDQLHSFNQMTNLYPTTTGTTNASAMPRNNSRGGFPGAGHKKFN